MPTCQMGLGLCYFLEETSACLMDEWADDFSDEDACDDPEGAEDFVTTRAVADHDGVEFGELKTLRYGNEYVADI